MAKYTIELRKIIDLLGRETVENWFKDYNLEDYLSIEEIDVIEKLNVWSKEKLAKKIVDHYYMREIGFETIGEFSHYAKVTMQEIIESKLPLIYTNALKYDPLVNVDFIEKFSRSKNDKSSTEGVSNSQSNSNGSGLSVNSDTPQGQISKQAILNGNYASNTSANENENTINDKSTSEQRGNLDSREEYTRHLKGNQGISSTYQALIKQYRENIVSIDKDIIHELNILFMGLF